MASEAAADETALFQVRHPEARVWHDLPADTPNIWIWGRCVESLWEIVMRDSRDDDGLAGAWDELTSRLLLWNAISGDSDTGEWARKETIRQMKIS
jgi:nucleolar pre-ribosomal-associated protein 1